MTSTYSSRKELQKTCEPFVPRELESFAFLLSFSHVKYINFYFLLLYGNPIVERRAEIERERLHGPDGRDEEEIDLDTVIERKGNSCAC